MLQGKFSDESIGVGCGAPWGRLGSVRGEWEGLGSVGFEGLEVMVRGVVVEVMLRM